MQNREENALKNQEQKNNIKSTKFTFFVKNLKGFFCQKRKRALKISNNEENKNESEFFYTLKKLIIENMKQEYIIKFFNKAHSLRTKIEISSIAQYLCQNEKNIFFNKIKKFGICYLYNTIQVLDIEQYKKGDIIFQHKDPTNKLKIILDGKISLNLPYFNKKLISIKEFLDYFFYLKNNSPKTFLLVENRNQYLFEPLQKLKLHNYDINSLSNIDSTQKKEFYVENSQKVSEIGIGDSLGEIGLLYNLPQNYNGIAESDIYLLTMNRSDFMKILRQLIENEILFKEFAKLRKYSYIFNSWSNFSLGQIMNYYIPINLIKKEILYKQNNFADSFYIVHKGTFDAYVDLSLSEFSKYKNYILKNNKNLLDWIREEKEKNKLTTDKIIEYIELMKQINSYPKDKEDIDKNLTYIKKRLLENGKEDEEQLINIKLNEDILAEKNTKIRIKLFTLQKNDFFGITDSLELKSRYFSIECTSDKGSLNKIRILDFIIFVAFNHGLDLQNIYEYLHEKKNHIVERVYKNLEHYLNNNKRIINNIYSLAFTSFEKRQNKIYKENVYTIANMKNLNPDLEGNNNLIDRIRNSINNKRKLYSSIQTENFTRGKSFHKKKQSREKTNNNIIELNNIYQKTEEYKSKPKLRLLSSKNKSKEKTQSNLSLHSFSKSNSSQKKNQIYKLKKNNTISNDAYTSTNTLPNFLKYKINMLQKEENMNCKNDNMYISPVMYNKKFELIKYKDISFDNKLEKYLTNFLGIYNTKREKSQKPTKRQIKHFDNKKLIFNNYMNNNQRYKKRIKSAYPSLMKNEVIREKKKDTMNMMRYLDKNKRNDIYKN